MVEKNVAYNRDGRSEEFADNDPMAELARIVGFEDRPSHVAPLAARRAAAPVIERREPEFNLEDELLREFEIYDAPRAEPLELEPANDIPANVTSGPGSFLERVESVFGGRHEPEVEARHEPEVEAHSDFRPLLDTGSHSSDLRDDFSSDEVFYELAEEPLVATPVAEVSVDEAAAYQDRAEIYEPVEYAPEPVVEYEPEPVAEAAAEWHEMPSWPGDERQGFAAEPAAPVVEAPVVAENFDLASEVEMAVAEPVAPVIQRRSSLEFSSLRLPLANFGARRDPVVEVPVAAPVVLPAVEAPHSDLSDDYYTSTEIPAQKSVSIASVPADQTLSAMDELIYDVARYSIRNNDVEASQPVAHLQPVEEAPVTISGTVQSPVTARSEPSFSASDDLEDFEGFADDAFELALEDIDFDIDLSDIGDEDLDASQSVRATQEYSEPVAPAPVSVSPVEPAPAPYVQPQTIVPPLAEIPQYQERHSAAPVAGTVAAAAVYEPPTLESLPFDPSQIGETEDQPETIAEMEVPELPVGVFEPKPTVRRSDDEMDIDSELATFFAPTTAGGFDRHKHVDPRGGPSQMASIPPEQADEFERALEEDFRRSMQEASASRAHASHDTTHAFSQQPISYGNDDRVSRRWVIPVAALGVVLVAGGIYAMMSGGSEGNGVGGAPVVISADNEPMKVVPENPGGTTVPNQDKAVYDRVAGGAPQDPKQSSLISTSEEPVDVVQRTLIPENLPLEGEGEEDVALGSTPVGETEDPRLLSREETAQGGQTDGNSPVNVAPRKVRTMIVKPDGTLVAQEVPEPSAPQATPSVATNNPAADEVVAPLAGQPAEQAPAVLSATRVPVAPPAAQPAAQTPSAASFPAADTQVATAPQARAAPVPSARPVAAQQPAQTAPAATEPAAPTQMAQAPAQAASPVATSTPSAGGYYIQIASLPSEAEAQKSYQNLSGKFGSVIGGRGVDIKRADIEGKGTYYRVRIPAGDRSAANTMCERYRAAGGSCLVAR